jgi:hypothetical protein
MFAIHYSLFKFGRGGSGPRVSATHRSHSFAHGAPTWAVRLLSSCLAFLLLLTPVASRQLTAVRLSEGDDLQAAINAARPGETIALAPGARFVGNFVLPNRDDAQSFITIRTDGPNLPAEGVRTGPAYAGRLAIIQSQSADAAIRTAPGAHHWRLENLEFRANADGHGQIIELGTGTQTDRNEVPHSLVLDRLYIRGDANRGQKRGVALNSASTEIRNCYIADIKGVGMDTQAIGGWNGPGPYAIENNYLEAAGENLMFGGADPTINGLVPQDIVIRRNVLNKPASWREALVATPTGLRGTTSATGGNLSDGAYMYRVTAERPAGQGITAVSSPTSATTITVSSTTTGSVALEWEPVTGAAAYRVYRSGGASGSMMWRTESARFTDNGTPGSNGTPREQATVWEVKNLFELKNARNVTFEGNLLERNWLAAQPGHAILLQVINQNGRSPWVTIENVRIVNNVVRHVSSALNILGVDQKQESGRARNITVANNLFVDVDRTWGGNGDFLQIGGGASEVTIEQNTVQHTGRIIAAHGGTKDPKTMNRFVFRNNLLKHNEYGVKGDGVNSGQPTLDMYFPGAVFEGNVIAGGPRAQYPLGNQFPSVQEFDGQFVNAAAGNYRLRPGSPLHGLGADLDGIERATGASTTAASQSSSR